jgi:hypothetical protein
MFRCFRAAHSVKAVLELIYTHVLLMKDKKLLKIDQSGNGIKPFQTDRALLKMLDQ